MKTQKVIVSVLMALAGASSAFALEATWVNESNGGILDYTNTSYWKDRSSGDAVTVAPTNAGDVAWFDKSTNLWQRINLPALQKSAGVNQMGTLKGTWHTRLYSSNADTGNSFRYYNYLFNDLSDFQGTLYPNRTAATFAFTGETPDVHIADLSVRLRPTVPRRDDGHDRRAA